MLCFVLHARLRVHLASGIPCALFYWAYEEFLQNAGAWRREIEFGCLKTCPAFVPRMLRSAPPFAAWCAADPGSIARHEKFESRLPATPRLRRAFAVIP